MLDLNEFSKECLDISLQRQKNGAKLDVADVLKHCAGEVIEAMQAEKDWFYRKLDSDKHEFEEELSDVIICILISAANHGIDIEKALLNKQLKNRLRAELKGDKL